MARRKFTLSPKAREAIILRADDFAAKLADGHLDKAEASDLAVSTIGDTLELAAKLTASPADDIAVALLRDHVDKIGSAIAQAVKPNLEKLAKKATKAMEEGNFKKARRILDRIDRIVERREEDPPAE